MKKIFQAALVICMITGSVYAKSMHKVYGTDEKIIRASCKIHLYEVDPIPVLSVEQAQGQDYVYDYHVLRKMEFKKNVAKVIADALLDSNQYLFGIIKKCPFMGKYAISFKTGKQLLTIIISAEPCEKAIIFCPGSIIDKKHIDLKENSTIVAGIRLLFDPLQNIGKM